MGRNEKTVKVHEACNWRTGDPGVRAASRNRWGGELKDEILKNKVKKKKGKWD